MVIKVLKVEMTSPVGPGIGVVRINCTICEQFQQSKLHHDQMHNVKCVKCGDRPTELAQQNIRIDVLTKKVNRMTRLINDLGVVFRGFVIK